MDQFVELSLAATTVVLLVFQSKLNLIYSEFFPSLELNLVKTT